MTSVSRLRRQREYRERRYSEKKCTVCGEDNERYPLRTCKVCGKKLASYGQKKSWKKQGVEE